MPGLEIAQGTVVEDDVLAEEDEVTGGMGLLELLQPVAGRGQRALTGWVALLVQAHRRDRLGDRREEPAGPAHALGAAARRRSGSLDAEASARISRARGSPLQARA